MQDEILIPERRSENAYQLVQNPSIFKSSLVNKSNTLASLRIEVAQSIRFYERSIKTMSSTFSDIGGIVAVSRTFAIAIMLTFHYRGVYQDITQKIFRRKEKVSQTVNVQKAKDN